MTKPAILTLVLVIFGQRGCGRSAEPLPEIKKPTPAVVARIPKPDFAVLEQEVSGIEAKFVVRTPDARKTSLNTMLRIADYLAQDREAAVQTLVVFRDPRQR